MKKKFSEHPKAIFLSKKNNIEIHKISYGSTKKYLFDCDKCNHEFYNTISNITYLNQWCPYCSNQKLCDNNNCNECFNKSFASIDKAIYWSELNKLKPINVFKSSAKKYLFDCNKCNHTFEKSLSKITKDNRWCEYCANQKLCDDNICNECFNKSFASCDKSIYWSKSNELKPRDVFISSANKFYFDCNNCGFVFEKSPSKINIGQWCPYCKNKTEQKLLEKLIKIYPTIKTQFKKNWCKNIKELPFDFAIENLNIIIELDGEQHFKQISNWLSPKENFKNDIYKMNCANNNNFSVIRILQTDIYYDKYDWLKEINDNINKIINDGITQNIFICKNNEYREYKNLEKAVTGKAF